MNRSWRSSIGASICVKSDNRERFPFKLRAVCRELYEYDFSVWQVEVDAKNAAVGN